VHHKTGRPSAANSHESWPGEPSFCIFGFPTEVTSPRGRTDNSEHRAWQTLGIIILIPAQDATQRRGAAATRQEAGLGARGVTKTTTGTRTSKPHDSDPPAHEQPTRRHNRCKPEGRKHGHTAHHPHPWQAQPAATIGPYAPCNQIHTAATTWPGKNYAAKAQAPGPACTIPSLRGRTRASPLGAQRKAGQHSDYNNCSIYTLHTAEILQPANGGREEEARATTLCMEWHAQQETSSCATIPTDTGRRGHSASSTSFAAGGVAMRVQYKQGQTAKER